LPWSYGTASELTYKPADKRKAQRWERKIGADPGRQSAATMSAASEHAVAIGERPTDNLRGAMWIVVSGISLTAMSVFLRLLADRHYPLTQMAFVRSIAGMVVLTPVMFTHGLGVWRAARPWPLFLRSFFGAIGLFASFYAFAKIPLPTAQSLSFTRVLFVTVLAAWIIKETVGPRRWIAVGIGFIGILVMLRPGDGITLDLATGIALASALFFALSIVMIKQLIRDHSPVTQILWMNLVTTLMGLPFVLAGWVTPPPLDFVIFAGLGITGVIAQNSYVWALAYGDASLMALLDYLRLPMAVVAALVVFGQAPDLYAMMGAAIIIGSTLYLSLREMQVARAKQARADAG
jgi:drug/metabolite transporter (DMT)-like permease